MNVGKIFGIKINLHYSWFFIFFLLTWSLATRFFPTRYPSLGSYWVVSIIASILLFVSVLAHELSHSLVAKYRGLSVESITLFFFGGLANASEEGLDAKKEFEIAIAGPALSVVLAAAFYGLTFLSPLSFLPVIDYLFRINLILAVFNMIPGFPLDGGRVLRAILWRITGNLRLATRHASNLGKAFGMLLIFFGFYSVFTGTGGLWYILLGGFLYILAKASYDNLVIKEDFVKIKVGKLMNKNFVRVSSEESVETFVEELKNNKTYLVQEKGEFYVIDFERLSLIPRHQWPVATLRQVMVKIDPLRETYNAFKALIKMQEQKANMLPIVRKDKIIGVLTLESFFKGS